jgi:uncharacterized membrane protein
MEILAILIGFFFIIVVPGLAIAAFSRANGWQSVAIRLEEQMGHLRRDLDYLLSEIRALKAAAVETPEAQTTASAKPARAAQRKTRQDTVSGIVETPDVALVDAAPIGVEEQKTPSLTQPPIFPAPADTFREEVVQSARSLPPPLPGILPALQPTAAPPILQPAKPARDLEEIIGTRWAVWVGGLALAIGGLFLVRYSIEAGVFGPRVRLAMAAVFSILLVSGGEALRRGVLMPKRIGDNLGAVPVAHVPLALTAAGVVAGFATVYAAFAVYGFLSPTVAFLLMGGIGLAAIAASLLHGQALAGIGLLASYATPILVGGESKSRWPLVIFLLVVTAAAMAVQNRLRTVWLAWGAVIGIALWSLLLIVTSGSARLPELTLIIAAMVLFAAALVWLASPSDDANPQNFPGSGIPETPVGDALPLVAMIGLASAMGFAFVTTSANAGLFVTFAIAAMLVLMATAIRDGRAALAIVAAVLLPLGMILTWPSEGTDRFWLLRVLDGAMLTFVRPPADAFWLTLITVAGAALTLVMPLALLFRKMPVSVANTRAGLHAIAFAGGLAAVILSFGWALRTGVQTRDLAVAGLFAGLMLVLGLISDRLYARRVGAQEAGNTDAHIGMEEIGSGAYASGAALALGLAIAFALPGLWMAVGFAMAALAISLLNDRRPLPALRRVAAFMATTAALRGVTSPAVFGDEAWPVLNWSIAAYGLPALALGAAAFVLRRQMIDRNVRVLEGASLLALAAHLFFEIRHGFHYQEFQNVILLDYAWTPFGFHETWVFVVAGLIFVALGLWLRRRDSGSPAQAAVFGGVAVMLVATAFYLGVLHNPFVHGIRVEGYVVFNRLTLAYGMSVLALAGGAWLLWRDTLRTPAKLLAGAVVALTGFWIITQIRMAFHGSNLYDRNTLGLGEAGVYGLVLIAITITLHQVMLRRRELAASLPVIPAIHASNLAAFASVFGLCAVAANPWLDEKLSGPVFFDSSFVGYLLTGAGFGLLAWLGRSQPLIDTRLTMTNRIAAIGLVYLYLITQVRRSFAGVDRFLSADITDGEHYAYSFTTLGFGVVLLAIGFKLASRETRLASAVFVTLAVAKVFLFDMAGLTGLGRAFSFIGLGAVLIGIGLVYQRLLFDKSSKPRESSLPPDQPGGQGIVP